MFSSLAYLERARIEDARGNPPLAQEYYQEFLSQYDLPPRISGIWWTRPGRRRRDCPARRDPTAEPRTVTSTTEARPQVV